MEWFDCIRKYSTVCSQEEEDKKVALRCFEQLDDILTREDGIAHITCSAFVMNENRDKVLLIHHNLFDSWTIPGGHADGDANLSGVAMREVKEETGIEKIKLLSQDIVSLDILSVFGHMKRGKWVSPHMHISVVYLMEGDEGEALKVKEGQLPTT